MGNQSNFDSPQLFRAYKWDPVFDQLFQLPSDGGPTASSGAWDINDAGLVVGNWDTHPDPEISQTRVGLWDGTQLADLGSFGGKVSTAHGINKWDQVVGRSADVTNTMRAFLWEDGTMNDLNVHRPPGSEWENLTSANEISDPGHIVGEGETNEGTRAFLLTPVCPRPNGLFTPLPDGTIDARQPHPVNDNSFSARQGIGSPNSGGGGPEPIRIIMTGTAGADDPACWELCETGIEQVEPGTDPLSDNFVESVVEVSVGRYDLYLNRPISAGHWTTITYLGDGSQVSYASLPADANGGGLSTFNDYFSLVNYINGAQTPPHGIYSTDINHSGVTTPVDLTRLFDLLNGASTFISWMNKSLPTNTCTAESAMGGGGGGTTSLTSSADSGQANAELSDAFVTFLTTQTPANIQEENEFAAAAQSITAFCMNLFSDAELAALADRLDDPALAFAGDAGADAAAVVVETIRS